MRKNSTAHSGLPVADALLERNASERCKEGADCPHRCRVAAHILSDGLRLRMHSQQLYRSV